MIRFPKRKGDKRNAAGRKGGGRGKRRWPRARKVVKFGLIGSLAAGVVGAAVAAYLLEPLYKKAQAFDMAEVAEAEVASAVYSRHGEVIGSILAEDRRPVGDDDLPDHLVDALVATEDSRFYSHRGYDILGIIRAALSNFKAGRVTEGASTITQQLARLTYEMREASYQRKVTEVFLARRIEQNYSKQEILRHYLNLVYLGEGHYGVESAALGYFGKHVSQLSLTEAATLVGIIKRPAEYNPVRNPELAKKVRDHTLRRMHAEGMIDEPTRDAAVAEPVAVLGPDARSARQFHIMGEVRRQLVEVLGEREASRDGLHIYTSLDPLMEAALRRAVREAASGFERSLEGGDGGGRTASGGGQGDGEPLEAAAVMIDNLSGELVAAVGGRDFGRSEFNRAFRARRPPGTAFVPFVYAAALEQGMAPYEKVLDSALNNREVMVGALEGVLGEWGAEDPDNTYRGQITAWEAVVAGKNAAAVQIGMRAGLENVLELAAKAGIETPLKDAPSTFLGQSEVTPAELALAFTIFPNRGFRPAGVGMIRRVTTADGSLLYERPSSLGLTAVTSAETAGAVHSALAEVLKSGTAREAVGRLGLAAMDVGGKTGTAYNFTDAWFAGYNSSLTCVVWAGYDQPRPIAPDAFGRKLALPAWVEAMNASAEFYPPGEIPGPPGSIEVKVCDRSGQKATPWCAELLRPFGDATADDTGEATAAGGDGGEGELRRVACTHTAYFTPQRASQLTPCAFHKPGAEITEPPQVFGKDDLRPPRASIASTRPVFPTDAILIGDDPYDSLAVSLVQRAQPVPQPPAPEPEPEPVAASPAAQPVPRAIPVPAARVVAPRPRGADGNGGVPFVPNPLPPMPKELEYDSTDVPPPRGLRPTTRWVQPD